MNSSSTLFITGGSGFIGSSVVKKAIKLGFKVINYDLVTYASKLGNLKAVENDKNYIFVHGDIRDYKMLKNSFYEFKPTGVMHLAAESHVDRSINGAEDFVDTNIKGTFILLEVAREYWTSIGKPENFRFHHVSTDEVFGSLGLEGHFTEKSSFHPNNPYAASKASSDHLVGAWQNTYDLPTVITNCSNNYGPFQFPEKLFPVIIINALKGKEIPIYGQGINIRDWLFVNDHADALLKVITKSDAGKRYTIGGDEECSNLELAKTICDILEEKVPKKKPYRDLIKFIDDRPGHDLRYSIDSSLIRRELNWKPKVDLKSGILKTLVWYMENEDWWASNLNGTR